MGNKDEDSLYCNKDIDFAANKSKELSKLQKIWYSKLKKEGFEDIESFDKTMEPRDMLKGNQSISKWMKQQESGNEDYYTAARAYIHTYKFSCAKHKKMWALHSEGKSFRVISESIKDMSYAQVKYAVTQIKREMLKDLTESTISEELE
jgi:hypothetical protein